MSGLDIEGALSAHVPLGVAAVLREQIDGALAEAWDRGLETGVVLVERGFASPNPYRAAHLSDTERAGDAE